MVDALLPWDDPLSLVNAEIREAEERERRDPLTECPEGCYDGVHMACCGHYQRDPEGGPSYCCEDPDLFQCQWCAANNKARSEQLREGSES